MMYIILGYGRVGKAVAKFLINNDIDFAIADSAPISDSLVEKHIIKEFPTDIANIKAIVASPGISSKYNIQNPFIQAAKQANIPIVSDIQLFMEMFPQKKYIAITGTNGKSTITTLTYEICKHAGIKASLSGNIGFSPFENAIDCDVCVLEVSSFQLEITNNVHFDLSLISNITPDHLDRYTLLENYTKEKLRITELSKKCIINETVHHNYKNTIPFSVSNMIDGYYFHDKCVYFGREKLSPIPTTPNPQNPENIISALALTHCFGINIEKIVEAIQSFGGIEHRLEFVREIKGVRFYNDSKATNLDSTYNALRILKGDILLIAGGKLTDDIDGVFSKEEFRSIKMIALIGSSAGKIKKELQSCNSKIKHSLCGNLQTATKVLFGEAKKYNNPIIVLSPFCKSFDQFGNFEERGQRFKEVVSSLQ